MGSVPRKSYILEKQQFNKGSAAEMLVTNLIITVLSFFAAGFFVACEFALVQTRQSEVKEDIQAYKSKEKKVPTKLQREMYMITHLNDYLSTTQVGVSFAGIIMGWVGETLVDNFFVTVLKVPLFHMNSDSAKSVGAIIGLIVLTFLEVVLTEVTPKNLSTAKSRMMLGVICTPLHYFHVIFYPLVWMINAAAAQTVKIFGIHMTDETNESLSQREILDVSKNAVKTGQLDKNDYTYMARAFKFNDKIARDIMVDRTQLVCINSGTTVREAIKVYLTKKFSRLPVIKNNNKDQILGYIYNYDIVRQAQVDPNVKVDKLLRNIITTPETTPITSVLKQMTKERTPLVVVVDEYGGTSGIITDRDIYDELFGTVRDEVDPSINTEFIYRQPKGTYQVRGKLSTYDFERYFQTEIPEFKSANAVTLSGYFYNKHPQIKVGYTVELDGFRFKVVKISHSFIQWFEVTPEKEIHHDKPAKDKSAKAQKSHQK